ncbi:unnamed protein product [Schistosoma rodhaini]|nr:unnamed protein product [Schistosoma rodhaini]
MPRYPPDRWFDYTALGVPVKGTRLLPIKLPIPSEKSYNIPPHLRFTLSDLIDCVQSCNQKLTCVIDLTYTKYYSTKFLHDNNISYHKIYVEGHAVPNSKTVEQFIDLVNKEREQSPDFQQLTVFEFNCKPSLSRGLCCLQLSRRLDAVLHSILHYPFFDQKISVSCLEIFLLVGINSV